MERLPKWQDRDGVNHGRKPSKVLQDCTICVSYCWTAPYWTVA